MWIKHLTVNNCRLLKNVSLDFSPKLNLIIGPNASGKTSLLESLSILSNGRSFRSSHISEVITHGKQSVLIAAVINDEDSQVNIGIEKSTEKTKIRINHRDIFSQAELSSHLPITVIHPNSVELITGPPSLRRSYVDWIAFYIFPDFLQKWKEYKHILKQRNICLKHKKHQYALNKWTEELVTLQPLIADYRSKVVEIIKPILTKTADHLLSGVSFDLEYQSGFPGDLDLSVDSLLEYYASKKEIDLKLKRTSAGVHRSDVKILMDSKPASQAASRGQLKLLAISLLLTQNNTIGDTKSGNGILLIDDLAAELDKKNREKLLNYLTKLNKQLIMTSTKEGDFKDIDFKMFHVKHGKFDIK